MGTDTGKQQRRGNTRQRIQDVALELFAEQGYEKTSLREIAERLEVTKAALYYHFKTKEDIIVSLFESLTHPIDDLIAWAKEQPRTLDTKKEVLRRYNAILAEAVPLFRFMHENQATMRDLSIGDSFKQRVIGTLDVLRDPGAPLTSQVRCFSALTTMHGGLIVLQDAEGDLEEKQRATLEVAIELVTRAHEEERAS